MKSLDEKKLLVKMARMLGQPVDQELVESIEREEKLTAALFGEKVEESPKESKKVSKSKEPKIPILKDDVVKQIPEEQKKPDLKQEELPPQPEKPAETGVQPPEESKVAQVAAYLDTVQSMPQSKFRDTELEAIRKTVADLLNKVNTLSYGGGGTGIVRIWDEIGRAHV